MSENTPADNPTDPDDGEPTESPIYTAPPPADPPPNPDMIPRRGEGGDGDGAGDGG